MLQNRIREELPTIRSGSQDAMQLNPIETYYLQLPRRPFIIGKYNAVFALGQGEEVIDLKVVSRMGLGAEDQLSVLENVFPEMLQLAAALRTRRLLRQNRLRLTRQVFRQRPSCWLLRSMPGRSGSNRCS